jgi:hypothetical protein
MSPYGKLNLLGIAGLPLLATAGSIALFGVRADTQFFVFGTNAIPMLIGGLVSALLLRSVNKSGGRGHWLALAPTLVPAGFGILWYLYGAVALTDDAGREYFAGPFYLLALAVATAVIASIGWIASRKRLSAT